MCFAAPFCIGVYKVVDRRWIPNALHSGYNITWNMVQDLAIHVWFQIPFKWLFKRDDDLISHFEGVGNDVANVVLIFTS